MLTRQTVQGRANDGGLRIGEMERDGVIAHGAAKFLEESLMKRGDEYYMAICNKTGTIAIYNNTLNLFLSPSADGPIKFTGTLDNNLNIENISRFGRSFSIVRVPYSFKLLMQELQTMNVQMRVITEDNVDQLNSMSYSRTINKLLFDEKVTVNNVIQSNKKKLERDNTQKSIKFSRKASTPEEQQMVPIQEEDVPALKPKNFAAIPPPASVLEDTTILPGSQQPEISDDPFDDDPFDDDPFDDTSGKPPITIGEVIPQSQTQPLQDIETVTTPEYSAISPSYARNIPSYDVSTPPPDIGYTPSDPIVAPVQPAVKATIEVPAGQQGQFTISSSSPVLEPSVAEPSVTSVTSDVDEQKESSQQGSENMGITGKEPISVTKSEADSSPNNTDGTKTIKILDKIE